MELSLQQHPLLFAVFHMAISAVVIFSHDPVLARFLNVWRKVVCGGREGIQYEMSTKKREKEKEGGRERKNGRERERMRERFITWVLVLVLPEAHLHPSVFLFCFDNSTVT